MVHVIRYVVEVREDFEISLSKSLNVFSARSLTATFAGLHLPTMFSGAICRIALKKKGYVVNTAHNAKYILLIPMCFSTNCLTPAPLKSRGLMAAC